MPYQKVVRNMSAALLSLAIAQTTSFAAEDTLSYESLSNRLLSCAEGGDTESRMDCYDALAKQHAQEKANAVTRPGALPKTLGGSKFDDNKRSKEQSVGTLKSCKKSQDGRWFYIFEDGQVWKQVDRAKRRYKECNFEVTVLRDGFGYKMRIGDQTSTVRIRRVR